MPQVIAAIEGTAKPFIAALHGAALGGGCELALGCDAYIASPDAVVGLPESALGIILAAGGTHTLPRLVGRAEAIRLIAGATRVRPDAAPKFGVIDAVEAGDARQAAIAMTCRLSGTKQRVIDRPVPYADDAETVSERASRRVRPHVLASVYHMMQGDAGWNASDSRWTACRTRDLREVAHRPLGQQEIQRRALASIIKQAAAIVAEGVALRPSDIDVVRVNGYGVPRWIGGPVHCARQQDADSLSADVARPSRKIGDLRLLGVDMGGNE
ncbi:hypothetical protein OCH239_10675 [Roseivivax halodurans JCM 10272]|uniref:Enoyl-CoA hydratase n=1 Tax=Roseivivax halodurans JCM 10272 TaxID=1449350 RepID=X7EDY6_9RHOB|nr:hypothetical protein OCH239_10675 [Roseivivax halodurans JCM 10272]